MKYNIFFYFNSSFKLGRFFHRSGFFRIGSGFLADKDPDSEKKLRIGEKIPDPKHCIQYCKNNLCYAHVSVHWHGLQPHSGMNINKQENFVIIESN